MPSFTFSVLRAIFIYKTNDLPFNFQFPCTKKEIETFPISSLSETYKELFHIYLRAKRSAENRIFVRDRCYDEFTRKESYKFPIKQATQHKEHAEMLMQCISERIYNTASPDEMKVNVEEEQQYDECETERNKMKKKKKKKKKNASNNQSGLKELEDEREIFAALEEIIKIKAKNLETVTNAMITSFLNEIQTLLLPHGKTLDTEKDVDIAQTIYTDAWQSYKTYFKNYTKPLQPSKCNSKDPENILEFKEWFIPLMKQAAPELILTRFGIATPKVPIADEEIKRLLLTVLRDYEPNMERLYLSPLIKIYKYIKHLDNLDTIIHGTAIPVFAFMKDHLCASSIDAKEQKVQAKIFQRRMKNHFEMEKLFEPSRHKIIQLAFGKETTIHAFNSWTVLNLNLDSRYALMLFGLFASHFLHATQKL